MYNGLIINQLLRDRKIKKNSLIAHMRTSSSGIESIINGNPTVNTLEKIADFFNVSMDVFFERESGSSNIVGNVSGNSNKIQQGKSNIMQASVDKEIENLKLLLIEKDKVISEKERLIGVLMKSQ